MIQLKQSETNVMKFSGTIEGFRILAHLKATTAGTALATKACDYKKIVVEWKCDGRTVFSGNLATLVQYLFFRAYDNTMRMQFLNAQNGIDMIPNSAGVSQYSVADLGVFFDSYFGVHEFTVRMNDCFDSATASANSYMLFDFDKSDEKTSTPFVINQEAVTISGNKGLSVVGSTTCILFQMSDNQFIENNVSKFNNINIHPVVSSSITSPYAENNYVGVELQNQEVYNVNGVVDLINSKKMVLQKTVRLSDREVLVNPTVNLQLNVASMASTVDYSIMYDVLL